MRLPISRRLLGALGIAAALVLAVAGCSSGGPPEKPSAGSGSGSGLGATSGSASTVQYATVTDTDGLQTFSTMVFTPGVWTFTVVNAGQTPHALEIEGNGVRAVGATLPPGRTGTLTVTLKSGGYDVFCPLRGHRHLNSEIFVTMAGGGVSSAPPNR